MQIFFLSSTPCAFKINGVFLGFTDGFERYVELAPQDNPLCEFIPLNGKLLPLAFTLNGQINHTMPEGIELYRLPDGLGVYAKRFASVPTALGLLTKQALPFGQVTVFLHGEAQALIERGGKSDVIPLGTWDKESALFPFAHFLLIEAKEIFYAVHEREGVFFQGRIQHWEYDENDGLLTVCAPLGDFGGRTAKYVFSCNPLPELKQKIISPAPPLPEQFMLCELLQNLALGLDVDGLLDGALADGLEELRGYFGKYQRVIPCAKYPFGAGMVCAKGEGVFQVKEYCAEVENGKIVNVVRKA